MSDKKFKVPHVYVILFLFIVVMTLLTYVIPPGSYDMVPGPSGREMVDPESYHQIEAEPAGLMDFLTAVPRGFDDAALVIAFTLILAGSFEVIKKTGLIKVAISNMSHKLAGKGIFMIPILMIVFGGLAAFVATPSLSMVYVPIILPLMLVLGFDSMTAVGTALIATGAGFTAAITNPFTIGLGQEIAGLPLYSGTPYRIVILVIVLGSGILYVMRYAKKVKNNPQKSITYEKDQKQREELVDNGDQSKLTFKKKHMYAGISFLVFFTILIIGLLKYGWYMGEMAGLFIAMGVVSGILGGLSSEEISNGFTEGAANVLVGALVIGIARGVTVVMNDAAIMDTVVHGLAQMVQALPSSINSIGMMVVQSLFNFLVPSGSGQTLITMPILSPLADIVGVNQQVAILALQFGDGISNIFYPTVGYFMATLAIAKVDWDEWVRFAAPLLGIWIGLSVVLLIVAQMINYGPF